LWKAAHRSAVIAERALTDLEGPFLYPTIRTHTIVANFTKFILYDHPTSPHEPVSPMVYFFVKNYGRTPALLRSVAAEFVHWTAMVESPDVSHIRDFAVDYLVAPGDVTYGTFSRTIRVPIDVTAFNSIAENNSRLFFYGEITYSDVFGFEYSQTFCFAYDYRTQRFMSWGAGYNKRTRKTQNGTGLS
jgi:hypothetical protein